MPHILLLHGTNALHDQLRAVRAVSRVTRVESWAELLHAARGMDMHSLVVCDPYYGGARALARELRELMTLLPSTSVVAALTAVPDALDDLRTLGEWGVAQLVNLARDRTLVALAQRLEAASQRSIAFTVLNAMPERVLRHRDLLAAALQEACGDGRSTGMAKRLHVSPPTLWRRVTRAGLPDPRGLIAWMRVLMAARMLDDSGRTVADIAILAGYRHDTSLHQALKRNGFPASRELRERGAFDTVMGAFMSTLSRPAHVTA